MDFSLRWTPLLPGWVTGTLLFGLLTALVFGTVVLLRRGVPRTWLLLLTALRLGCLAIFALILLQPSFSQSSSEKELPELVVLMDHSGSMALPSKVAAVSRWQEVTGVLQEGPLARNLRECFSLHWHTFTDTAQPRETEPDKQLTPSGPTRLAESLEAVCQYQRSLGRPVDRLLLVSDGCDHGLSDALSTARSLGVRVDVLAPTPSATSESATVELIDVQCARRVLLGSETTFRISLRRPAPARDEQKILVAFSENGKNLGNRPLTLKAGASEQTFFLHHRPETAGLKTYDFALAGADARKIAPLQRAVEVVDSHFEVLILEDTWRWEYKYLHRLFEDDPSFRFSALLNRGSGSFVQFGSPDRRVQLIGFPQNQAELERFDLFFLGDVNPTRWPTGIAAGLARLVTDEGKSLVVIAGPQLAQIASFPELHRLLPVELDQAVASPVEGPIEIRQRPEASSSPFFFQLRGGAEQLPAVDRVYPAVRKRAGATVLLEAAKKRNSFGNLILMAEQTVGRGRVLFVATDTLWKWHTLAPAGEGPTPYATFWQQAFRALTPQRSSLQNVQLWLTPSRTRAEVGQPIQVEAEVQAGRPLPGAILQAAVTLPDQRRLPLVFVADPVDPRRYKAEFASPAKGQLAIGAQLVLDNKVAAEANVSLQVEEPGDESRDVHVDLPALTRIAQGTGGKVVDPEHSDTWPETTEPTDRVVERIKVVDLWNNFTLLFALIGILAVDWFVRVFKGLV